VAALGLCEELKRGLEEGFSLGGALLRFAVGYGFPFFEKQFYVTIVFGLTCLEVTDGHCDLVVPVILMLVLHVDDEGELHLPVEGGPVNGVLAGDLDFDGVDVAGVEGVGQVQRRRGAVADGKRRLEAVRRHLEDSVRELARSVVEEHLVVRRTLFVLHQIDGRLPVLLLAAFVIFDVQGLPLLPLVVSRVRILPLERTQRVARLVAKSAKTISFRSAGWSADWSAGWSAG